MAEDVTEHAGEGLDRRVADAVLLRLHLIAENRPAVFRDAAPAFAALAAEPHALHVAFEVDRDARIIGHIQAEPANDIDERRIRSLDGDAIDASQMLLSKRDCRFVS